MKKTSNKQFAESLYEVTLGLSDADLDLVLQKFVELLARHRRLKQADRIIAEFENIVKRKNGVVGIEITSARKLDEKTLENIKNVFGEKVEAIQDVDEDLIGGIKIRMEDKILDGSIKTQLKNLQQSLI